MVTLLVVQLLLLALQVLALLVFIQTEDGFWLVISNIFFAGVIGMMVYILMSYGLA